MAVPANCDSEHAHLEMSPVRDLRTGLATAYRIVHADLAHRTTWRRVCDLAASIGFSGPLQVTFPHARMALADLSPWLASVADAAGLAAAKFDVVVHEEALTGVAYDAALAGLERLRARGCGVCIELQDRAGFPLAARGRAAASEIRLHLDDAPLRLSTLMAASEAGIAVTAIDVAFVDDQALLRAGFDRRG